MRGVRHLPHLPPILSALLLAITLLSDANQYAPMNEWTLMRYALNGTGRAAPALAFHAAAPLVLPASLSSNLSSFFSPSSSTRAATPAPQRTGAQYQCSHGQSLSLNTVVFGGAFSGIDDTWVATSDMYLFSLSFLLWKRLPPVPQLSAISSVPAVSIKPLCSSLNVRVRNSPSQSPPPPPSSNTSAPLCAPFVIASNTPAWVHFGWPAARTFHMMETLVWAEEYVVVVLYGGRDSSVSGVFGDTWLWQYTPDLLQVSFSTAWLNVTQPNQSGPPPRLACSSTTHNNFLYMAGGELANGVLDMSVWRFALLSASFGAWTLLLPSYASGGPPPVGLFSFGIFSHPVTKKDFFLLSGGFAESPNPPSASPMSPMWTAAVPPTPNATTDASCAWINASAACLNPAAFSYTPPSQSPWQQLPQLGPALGCGRTVRTSVGDSSIQYQLVWIFGVDALEYEAILSSSFLTPVLHDNVFVFDTSTMAWQALPSFAKQESFNFRPGSLFGFAAVAFAEEVIVSGGLNTFSQYFSSFTFSAIVSSSSVQGDASLVWLAEEVLSAPQDRYFAVGIVHQGQFIVFGGWLRLYTCSSNAWAFDLTTQSWSQLPILDILPSASSTVVAFEDILYTYGGQYQLPNGSLYLHSLVGAMDPLAMTFNTVTPPSGPQPPARELHTAVLYNGAMFIFGGSVCPPGSCSNTAIYYGSNPVNDLWVFNFSTSLWREIVPASASAPWPAPRVSHTAVVLFPVASGPAMFVFGGQCAFSSVPLLNDLWAFYFRSETWVQLFPSGNTVGPVARLGHYAVALGKTNDADEATTSSAMQIFNGVTLASNGGVLELLDSWMYDAMKNSWTYVFNASWIDSSVPGQMAYGFDPSSSTVLAFGGLENAFSTSSPTYPTNQLVTMQLGCSRGMYSANYSTVLCLPCPIGTFASTAGATACQHCPPYISTKSSGSSSLAECSICQDSVCAHGGTCSVQSTASSLIPVCISCPFPYAGRACEAYSSGFYVSVFLPLAGTVVAIVVGLIIRARVQEQKRQQQLLDAQVREAEAVFTLAYDDLVMKPAEDPSGEGSSGKVIRGRYWGMPVAIKLLINVEQLAAASEEELVLKKQAFAEEGKTLASLHHANIVRYFGTSTDPQDNLLLVMEFCERGSLFDVLHRKTGDTASAFGWKELWGFAYDCSKGMAFLHSRGRAHNDLKSLNLFVSENWTVKVGDFGDAEKLSGRASGPTSGSGTLLWKAPERIRGYVGHLRHDLPGASDVYSFGVVMWEIAAPGMLPYEDITFNSQIESGVAGGTLRPDLAVVLPPAIIPPAFIALMQRAWAQAPEDRPTFEEAMEDLEVMMASHDDRQRADAGTAAQGEWPMRTRTESRTRALGGAGRVSDSAARVPGASNSSGGGDRIGSTVGRIHTTPVHLRSGEGRWSDRDSLSGSGSAKSSVVRAVSGKGQGRHFEMSELLLPRDDDLA